MIGETEPGAPPVVSRRVASIALTCAIALAGSAYPTAAAAAALRVAVSPTAQRAPHEGPRAFGSGTALALEEQSLPPEDLASPTASPAASPAPPAGSQSPGGADASGRAAGEAPASAQATPPAAQASPDASSDDDSAAGWTRVPAGAGGAAASAAPPAPNASGPTGPAAAPPMGTPAVAGSPVAGEPTPEASPTEVPPPYDVGSIQPTAPVSDQPLTALIASAKDQPALNASLRFTEDGRKALESSRLDDAIRDLGRAVSIDPTDPYAYFYLGRAYMMKKDYPQALAFFGRSEVGVRAVPAWLGEVKSFEGACLEEQGKFPEAAAAYKQALEAAPGNLMARIGYGRLTQNLSDANAGNTAPPPAPLDGAALPAPEVNLAAPAPPASQPNHPDSAADSNADWSTESSDNPNGAAGGANTKGNP